MTKKTPEFELPEVILSIKHTKYPFFHAFDGVFILLKQNEKYHIFGVDNEKSSKKIYSSFKERILPEYDIPTNTIFKLIKSGFLSIPSNSNEHQSSIDAYISSEHTIVKKMLELYRNIYHPHLPVLVRNKKEFKNYYGVNMNEWLETHY